MADTPENRENEGAGFNFLPEQFGAVDSQEGMRLINKGQTPDAAPMSAQRLTIDPAGGRVGQEQPTNDQEALLRLQGERGALSESPQAEAYMDRFREAVSGAEMFNRPDAREAYKAFMDRYAADAADAREQGNTFVERLMAGMSPTDYDNLIKFMTSKIKRDEGSEPVGQNVDKAGFLEKPPVPPGQAADLLNRPLQAPGNPTVGEWINQKIPGGSGPATPERPTGPLPPTPPAGGPPRPTGGPGPGTGGGGK